MLLLNNYTRFNMIKNIYRKNTKSNDSNILLIIILSVILIISMFAGLFLFSKRSDSNIIEEKSTLLYPINNKIVENIEDIIYRNMNYYNSVGLKKSCSWFFGTVEIYAIWKLLISTCSCCEAPRWCCGLSRCGKLNDPAGIWTQDPRLSSTFRWE